MTTSEDLELFHYGVKGMKWGVRKDRPKALEGVPGRTNRDAKRDANEFAKAKMFYGEGAGNRRKLIKTKVETKSNRDSAYKRAFDYHLDNQDMAKRASKATGERRRKDVVKTTAKTARGVKNLAMKTGAPVTLTAVAAYGAYQNPVVRRTVSNAAKTTYRAAKNSPATDFVKKQFGG